MVCQNGGHFVQAEMSYHDFIYLRFSTNDLQYVDFKGTVLTTKAEMVAGRSCPKVIISVDLKSYD